MWAKSHETSKIKTSRYFGVSTKIAEHTIIKEHGNMVKWIHIKVCIKGSLKQLKYTILLARAKSHEASKTKTLHYFGAYTKIVEHIISKEQINTSLNTRFCWR